MNYIVTLGWTKEEEALTYAKKYCPSYITNNVNLVKHKDKLSEVCVDYHFVDEKDALMFRLRWVGHDPQ